MIIPHCFDFLFCMTLHLEWKREHDVKTCPVLLTSSQAAMFVHCEIRYAQQQSVRCEKLVFCDETGEVK